MLDTIARMWFRVTRILEVAAFVALCSLLLTSSAPRATTEADRVAAFTRGIEFDYLSWIANAAAIKIQQGSVGVPGYLDRATSRVLVSDYLQVTQQESLAEDAISRIYADAS